MKKQNEVAGSGAPDSVPKTGSGIDEAVGSDRTAFDHNMQEILDDNIGALLELMTELKTDITDEWRKVKRGRRNANGSTCGLPR